MGILDSSYAARSSRRPRSATLVRGSHDEIKTMLAWPSGLIREYQIDQSSVLLLRPLSCAEHSGNRNYMNKNNNKQSERMKTRRRD